MTPEACPEATGLPWWGTVLILLGAIMVAPVFISLVGRWTVWVLDRLDP